ncbi:MAG: hypothetical protein AABW68_03070 [archaeon]
MNMQKIIQWIGMGTLVVLLGGTWAAGFEVKIPSCGIGNEEILSSEGGPHFHGGIIVSGEMHPVEEKIKFLSGPLSEKHPPSMGCKGNQPTQMKFDVGTNPSK